MKIKIQFITQVYLIVALISGLFYEVMTLYFCLFFHELGHIIMILLLKKKIVLLEISPIGGILHIDKCQNDHNYKEFLIYLSGPLFSLGLYLVLLKLNVSEILLNSAIYVLILNLLPILPLDGAKIMMSLKQNFFPYRKVLKILSLLSIIVCFGLIFYFINNVNYVGILIFFVYLNLVNYNDIPYNYFSFLWYKFLHPNENLPDKNINTINNPYNLFYKGYNNRINHRSEIEILNQILKQK